MKQKHLDDAQAMEYAMNYQLLSHAGLSKGQQRELEKGLKHEGILKMQREKLASMGKRVLAPKPSVDADGKGGPAK